MTVLNQFDDNETLWALDLNALTNALGPGGIISGCSISKGTGDWDIDVTSGSIIEANTEASISSGTVTITDSSALTSGQSRVTAIHADTGDALASTDGSAASNPASPDIPASEVLLGFVIVADTDSTVADSDIFDIPALLQNKNALYQDGGSHELDAADLTGSSGTSGQVLESDGSAASWVTRPRAFHYSHDLLTGESSHDILGVPFGHIDTSQTRFKARINWTQNTVKAELFDITNSNVIAATSSTGSDATLTDDSWSNIPSSTVDLRLRVDNDSNGSIVAGVVQVGPSTGT